MKKAISTYSKPFFAIIGLSLIALGVGGFILANQRFYLPKWVPVLGSDFVDYKAELPTAQSITPGQGQTVNVAGVPVGEISKVDLVDGRAVVTMKIRRRYATIYKDATVLVRPKTGLNDEELELTPGSRAAGEIPKNGKSWIPVSQSLSQVNLDEVLASLDGDTRDYLKLLLAGAGEGLGGQGHKLAADFKRFEPTSRELLALTKPLAQRRQNISRAIHNFGLLSQALAGKDKDLSQLVDSSNAVFKAFANQDKNIRATLSELPGTLRSTQTNLAKTKVLADNLGPTLGALRPAARALGPSLRQTRPFLRQTTPVIKNQLRPFARDVRPTVRDLRTAAAGLAAFTPRITSALTTVNYLLNELAYDNPKDNNESFLFYASWANHVGNAIFTTGDAHGPTRRGAVVVSCLSLTALDSVTAANPQLALLTAFLDPVKRSDVCPKSAQGNATPTQPTVTVPGGPTVTVPSIPPVPTPPVAARSGQTPTVAATPSAPVAKP